MKTSILAATALGLTAATANAGGIDRSGQSINVLFEQGRYGELSLGSISPDVSGTSVAGLGSAPSGDMSESYLQFGAAYKADLNSTWSYALIYDQPFGADVNYPTGTGYFAQGAQAEFTSRALTGILRYKMPSNISVYGGVRVQSIEATAAVPFVAGYSVVGDRDVSLGYLAGVSFEKPEIALRVSLTYNSKIKHDVNSIENSASPLGGPNVSNTPIDTPQSLNLEFQSGIAADTLVFGSVRWVEWSEFDITPNDYKTLTSGGSLVSYADDVFTYTLGVGRRLNENWSVAASVGYEKSNGGFASNLGPTDGNKSVGIGATYTQGNMKITGGVRYINIGDAQTQIPGFAPASNFNDNDAVAFGMKVGFTF